MKKTIQALGYLLLFGTVLAACTTVEMREGPAPGINVRDPNLPNARIRMNSVAIIDKSLQYWEGDAVSPSMEWLTGRNPAESEKKGKIAVETTTSRRTPTGTLEAIAVLRNRTDFPLQVEGRVQFFDGQQIPVERPTAWQRMHLNANGVETYRGYSTKVDEINYYYIELREGR